MAFKKMPQFEQFLTKIDYTPLDKNLNYNCFTDSNYFNRRILEVTEKGELAALLLLTQAYSPKIN